MTDEQIAKGNISSRLFHFFHRIRAYGLPVILGLIVWVVWLALRSVSSTLRVGATLAAAGSSVLLLLLKTPQWQISNLMHLKPEERFELENKARTTLAQVIVGIVLLIGIYGTWRNFTLAQQGQITDRFTKAIDQLGGLDNNGNKKLEVRVGGIYALERIAAESDADHWPIIEVLSTYVRENAPRKAPLVCADAANIDPAERRFPADIQAILTVLGRRETKGEPRQRLDLKRADLSGGADMRDAKLHLAYLSRADLSGADMRSAHLDEAFLTGACLRGAILRGADLHKAHLGGADFLKADLRCDTNQTPARPTTLRYAEDLTQKQIDEALGDATTILPDSVHKPDLWKSKPCSR